MSYRRKRYTLRSGINYNIDPEAELRQFNLTADVPLSERYAFRFTGSETLENSRSAFLLSLNALFQPLSLAVAAGHDDENGFTALFTMTTSFAKPPNRKRPIMTGRSVTQGGHVMAAPFLDDDQDGMRSDAEQIIQSKIVAGGYTRSDDRLLTDGYFVTGLSPDRPTLVSVDQTSLLEEGQFLSAPDPVAITPRRGRIIPLDLVLLRTGEIVGETINAATNKPLGAVKVELVNQLGKVVDRATSEFDGYFAFLDVPYGYYMLRVENEQAQRLGLAVAGDASAVVNAEQEIVEGFQFSIQVAPPASANDDAELAIEASETLSASN
ncbi:MAG: carboxypeptidase regulatory-like domain-containing protein [Parvularculaceae bacterium]|nr:carboxypeptidase regulatory-like domain-containing protein [Parvularculaceae bacterium]